MAAQQLVFADTIAAMKRAMDRPDDGRAAQLTEQVTCKLTQLQLQRQTTLSARLRIVATSERGKHDMSNKAAWIRREVRALTDV